MKKTLVALIAVGAIALAACGTATATNKPATTTAVPTTTTAPDPVPTTTTAAPTTTETPTTTTTEASEPEWLSTLSDEEIQEAKDGMCMMVAFSWDAGEPVSVDEYGDEFIALITDGSPSAEDSQRAIDETGHLFGDIECPSEVEGVPIPDGADEYLAEVGEYLLDTL